MTRILKIDEFTSKCVNEMAVKPSVFSQYDEVDIFDSNYFKVMKNGLYNLIDRNGKPISSQWFENITHNNDGTFSVTVKNDVEKSSSVGTYSSTGELEKSIEIDNNLKDITGLPAGIVFTDIIPVKPYTIKSIGTDEQVYVIAKVKYDGLELLLGKDGKLYTSDGREYISDEQEYDSKLIEKFYMEELVSKINNGGVIKDAMFKFFDKGYGIDLEETSLKSYKDEYGQFYYELPLQSVFIDESYDLSISQKKALHNVFGVDITIAAQHPTEEWIMYNFDKKEFRYSYLGSRDLYDKMLDDSPFATETDTLSCGVTFVGDTESNEYDVCVHILLLPIVSGDDYRISNKLKNDAIKSLKKSINYACKTLRKRFDKIMNMK